MFRLLGAAAAMALIAGPAAAQEVIYEPGYCAFYYPNANCQNNGPGNPLDRSIAPRVSQMVPAPAGAAAVAVVRKRSHKPATRTP